MMSRKKKYIALTSIEKLWILQKIQIKMNEISQSNFFKKTNEVFRKTTLIIRCIYNIIQ